MIESVWIGQVGDDDEGANADVVVRLKDGRAYAFTAFTPQALARQMQQDQVGYFLCEDLLVLADITEEHVRAAVADMLDSDSIERFGILQR
jgi:hypothetical protein